jgi:cytoskeletal protein RodZ
MGFLRVKIIHLNIKSTKENKSTASQETLASSDFQHENSTRPVKWIRHENLVQLQKRKQNLSKPTISTGQNCNYKNLSLHHILFQMTFDELAAERASDGAKPSKTDTAAPTSRSDMDCKSRNIIIPTRART